MGKSKSKTTLFDCILLVIIIIACSYAGSLLAYYTLNNNTAKVVIIISNAIHRKGQRMDYERSIKLKEHRTRSDHGEVKRYGHFVKQLYCTWSDCWGRYETMADAMEAVRIAGTGYVENLANPAV